MSFRFASKAGRAWANTTEGADMCSEESGKGGDVFAGYVAAIKSYISIDL